MSQTGGLGEKRPGQFNPLMAILTVALFLSAVSFGSGWYAEKVLMPRYCTNIPETVRLLEKVLTEKRPAEAGSRVPYLIAARITHLRPRRSTESIPVYLERLQRHLRSSCNGATDSPHKE
jgi:hypothetical protein